MYRLSLLQTVCWLVFFCAVICANDLTYNPGFLELLPLFALVLAPAGGAYLLIRAGRIYAARTLLLLGLLPVCCLGLYGSVAVGALALTTGFGLEAQVLNATISALLAITTLGAVRGTACTLDQLPDRPGIAAALRGRRPAAGQLPAAGRPGR